MLAPYSKSYSRPLPLLAMVSITGLEIKIFSREPDFIFKSHHVQVLCIETNKFLGSLQKFGAAGEFKGALGSWHPIISSPVSAMFLQVWSGPILENCCIRPLPLSNSSPGQREEAPLPSGSQQSIAQAQS